METIHKLEVTMAAWYKGLPHLPEGVRKWIANNVWWLVLVGVILSLMIIIPAFGVLLFSSAIVTTYGATQSAYYGAAFIPALLGLIILVVDIVLSILAISPLKAHQKRGWTLLFMTMLLGVLSGVLTLFADQDFGSFLSSIIGAAIGGYLLFEIRDKFSAVGATNTQVTPAPATPAADTTKKV